MLKHKIVRKKNFKTNVYEDIDYHWRTFYERLPKNSVKYSSRVMTSLVASYRGVYSAAIYFRERTSFSSYGEVHICNTTFE